MLVSTDISTSFLDNWIMALDLLWSSMVHQGVLISDAILIAVS
jgi:hypothetical protein